MSQENSSRRSHRTVRISRKAQLALLGISTLVFMAGFGAFAWAIADVRADAPHPSASQGQQTQPGGDLVPIEAPNAQSAEESGEADSETGRLKSSEELIENPVPGQNSARASAHEKDSARPANKKTKSQKKKDGKVVQSRRSKKTAKEDNKPRKGSTAKKAKQKVETAPRPKPEPSSQPASRPQASAQAESKQEPAHRTVKIHHTAYRKITVYRTRRHKATSSIESETESDAPQHGACPFCGKKHRHGFTERIFDHYEYKYCKACGKKHARAYTEVVSTS